MRDFAGLDVSDVLDAARKAVDFDVAGFFERGDFGRLGHIRRQIEDRDGRQLGIDDRLAVVHGSRKLVPGRVDIGVDGLALFGFRRELVRSGRRGGLGEGDRGADRESKGGDGGQRVLAHMKTSFSTSSQSHSRGTRIKQLPAR